MLNILQSRACEHFLFGKCILMNISFCFGGGGLLKHVYCACLAHIADVNVLILVTRESSGFYSVQSTLEYKVIKEDKDSFFSCEVSFSVPGAIRTMESHSINVTVHCESISFLCCCTVSLWSNRKPLIRL